MSPDGVQSGLAACTRRGDGAATERGLEIDAGRPLEECSEREGRKFTREEDKTGDRKGRPNITVN